MPRRCGCSRHTLFVTFGSGVAPGGWSFAEETRGCLFESLSLSCPETQVTFSLLAELARAQIVALAAIGLAAIVTLGLWVMSNLAGGAGHHPAGRDEL